LVSCSGLFHVSGSIDHLPTKDVCFRTTEVTPGTSSLTVERNVLEAVDPRLLVLRVIHLLRGISLHRLGVLKYATAAVGRRHESREASTDHAFAKVAGDVGHTVDRSAVLALG